MLLALLMLRAPGKTLALIRKVHALPTIITLAAGIALLWRSNDPAWVLAYPVFMNAFMLVIFAATLIRPPSLIERLARLKHHTLPPEGVAYTRRVTQLWCGFFVINGLVAAWTVFAASREVWVLYNGLISYLLMGLLFVGEWLYRRRRFGAEATP